MKKMLLIASIIGLLGYSWYVMHDGAYDPKAKYIGNIARLKFHKITCKHVKRMAEHNKFYALTKEKLLRKGMKSCGYCKP